MDDWLTVQCLSKIRSMLGHRCGHRMVRPPKMEEMLPKDLQTYRVTSSVPSVGKTNISVASADAV